VDLVRAGERARNLDGPHEVAEAGEGLAIDDYAQEP
jgi:hypothetical protein